jgi:hypothetical protein
MLNAPVFVLSPVRSYSTVTTAMLAGHPQLEYLLARVDPGADVAESPGTACSDAALSSCIDSFPEARFIHLTRHPVTAILSMEKFCRRRPECAAVSDQQIALTAASAWYHPHYRIIAALAALPDERWMRVRAEDLLGQPYSWLASIVTWLGLPWTDEISARMLHPAQWRLEAPSLDYLSALRLPEEVRSRIGALARYLGY